MLILLRSYSFIPDVARVTSEPRANIKVFASGIVRLLPPTWKERERERFLRFRENRLGHSIFMRFYLNPFFPFSSPTVSFRRTIHDKAVLLLTGIRPFRYPKPRAKIIDSTRCVLMESRTKSIDCIRLSRVIIPILCITRIRNCNEDCREDTRISYYNFFSFEFLSPVFPWLNDSSIMFSKLLEIFPRKNMRAPRFFNFV